MNLSTNVNNSNDTLCNEPVSIEIPSRNESDESPVQSKFDFYALNVDPDQGDRATEIKLFSVRRPHMRSFHYAWWCYHVAFLMWFSISPLLSEVQASLGLSKDEIWTSSISAVTGTVIMRFVLGPFCDKFGPRIPMGIVLFVSAVPTGLIGLVNSATQLTIIRFFIGIGGSTFVMCQYWTTQMFSKQIVGTANATVAGWGNLGGGVTQVVMGSLLFPLFKKIYNGDATKAWRTVCIIPATMGLITSVCVIKYTDDSPKGNYSKFRKQKTMEPVSVSKSFSSGALDFNTWLLFIQYACCFGVEITMNNAASLYFKEAFELTTEKAAAIASIFGWMNLFARGVGGLCSDKANARMGMRGRLLWQSLCLVIEGSAIVVFAYCTKLSSSIVILVFFSIFVQACEGSTYGIVPYVNPAVTGSISGIVGAGGNVGAMAFSLGFRQLTFKSAFLVMGFTIIGSSFLSLLVQIKGQNGLLFSDANAENIGIKNGVNAVEDVSEGTESRIDSSVESAEGDASCSFDGLDA